MSGGLPEYSHAVTLDSEFPNRCRNVNAAQKWLERLHEDHFDRLNQLRREMNIQNPIFPLTFALTSKGRSLDTPERVWEAVMSCTTYTRRVEFVDPPRRGHTITPVAQTVLTDIPPHASVHFKRKDSLSKFHRAKIANTIRELVEYSLCIPLEQGMTIHHSKSCTDPAWMNINILWLMGHEFDEMTREQINKRSHQLQNMWRNGLLSSHQTSFSNTNHFLRGYPDLYTSQWRYSQDVSSYSDGMLTDRDDDDENRSPSEVHFSWPPEVADSMTVEDEQNQAFTRFRDKITSPLRHIVNMVDRCTRRAEPRWKFLIDWTKPESLRKTDRIGNKFYTRYEMIRHKYYSEMTKVLVKRLVREQLLHYQGNTPSARHPLMMDANGRVHPTSRIFFLLERMLGMTHKELVKKLVHIARRNMQRRFGKEYSSDSEGDGPWQIPASRNFSGASNTVHLQGLDSGYSSNSMGDGPMWIPITMGLRDAIDACASLDPHCDINAATMNATFEKTLPPWNLLATWDGLRTADAVFLFISYGYQCGRCGKHFIGDDHHTDERAVACAHCAIISLSSRLWLVNADHDMVRTALRTLDRTLDVQTPTRNICCKLELSHLTPVKGSHLQDTDQCITSDSRILFISQCDKCGELVQPTNRMIPRKCLMCQTPLKLPVECAINEDIHYDATVQEKFLVSSPTAAELIMAGMSLSLKERATQANNTYIKHLPSWPLTTPEEIKSAVCSQGLRISCGAGYYSMTAMKTQTSTFESMEKLVGVSPPSGFGTLSYLTAMTATARTERFKQQADLLRYLRDVGFQPILFALSRGELLIYSEKEENISTLASGEIRSIVQSICAIAAGWPTYRLTYLHKEAKLLSQNYTNLIALDARVILIIDPLLRRSLRKFLPPSFITRMNFVSQDFAADRLPFAGMIALMLSDDKSEGYMTAKSDRAELDKALNNVKLTKDMSIEHSRVLYQNALDDYSTCSAIQKWVDTHEGDDEQIEFLLHLLGEGKLKETEELYGVHGVEPAYQNPDRRGRAGITRGDRDDQDGERSRF